LNSIRRMLVNGLNDGEPRLLRKSGSIVFSVCCLVDVYKEEENSRLVLIELVILFILWIKQERWAGCLVQGRSGVAVVDMEVVGILLWLSDAFPMLLCASMTSRYLSNVLSKWHRYLDWRLMFILVTIPHLCSCHHKCQSSPIILVRTTAASRSRTCRCYLLASSRFYRPWCELTSNVW